MLNPLGSMWFRCAATFRRETMRMLINIYQQGSNSRSDSPRNRLLLTNNTQPKQTDRERTAHSDKHTNKLLEEVRIYRDLKNTIILKKISRNIHQKHS